MDNNRHRMWSEGRESKSTAADALEGLDFEQMENVKEEVTRAGVLHMGNCLKCGRQWKMISKWPEIAGWFLGQAVPETQPTRQGILTSPKCPVCATQQRFIIPWHDVKNHVDMGVRSAMIPATIYQATVFGR